VNDEEPRTERTRLAVAGARAGTAAVVGGQPRKDVIKNTVFAVLLFVAILLALLGLAALLIQAFVKGEPRLGLDLFTESGGSDPTTSGFKQAIMGSLLLIAGVIVLIVPLGIGAAIYLEEYANKERLWNRLIELNIQNLAAVPSIIYGILGLGFIVRGPLDLGEIPLAGSMVLALLVLPIVIIAAREAIRAVPPSIREGSLALGATKWQTIRHQVLPASIAGIATGVILAVSRAIGETAPLLLVGAAVFVTFDPSLLQDGYTALPVQIFQYATRPQDEFRILSAAGIIVLLLVLLVIVLPLVLSSDDSSPLP
jgi:phosphate transport system permease protein